MDIIKESIQYLITDGIAFTEHKLKTVMRNSKKIFDFWSQEFKATEADDLRIGHNVHGKDPEIVQRITYREVLEKQLKVMDASAISLCMDNNLPIMVFNMRESQNIVKAVCGDLSIGTLVTS